MEKERDSANELASQSLLREDLLKAEEEVEKLKQQLHAERRRLAEEMDRGSELQSEVMKLQAEVKVRRKDAHVHAFDLLLLLTLIVKHRHLMRRWLTRIAMRSRCN